MLGKISGGILEEICKRFCGRIFGEIFGETFSGISERFFGDIFRGTLGDNPMNRNYRNFWKNHL